MLRNNREFCPFPGLLSQDLAAPRACLTSPPFPGGLWKSWQGFILSASWVQSRQSLCQGRLYPKGVVTGRPNGAELSRRLRTRCSPDFTPVLLRALPLTPATCTESGARSGSKWDQMPRGAKCITCFCFVSSPGGPAPPKRHVELSHRSEHQAGLGWVSACFLHRGCTRDTVTCCGT